MRVLGAPFNSAGRPDGVANAPRVLRESGLMSALDARRGGVADGTKRPTPTARSRRPVTDVGDVDVGTLTRARDPRSRLRSVQALTTTTEAVRQAVADALGAGDVLLVVGGDCAVLLGCLRAAQDLTGAVGLLFVDGHEDAWPPAASTTGEAADSELGLALGAHRVHLPPALTRALPTLAPEAVVALGPRDADELAQQAIPSLTGTITLAGAEQVRADPAAAAGAATGHLLRYVDTWWLHVDLDVLSSEALPAVDYPQPGGISWPDLHALTATALLAPGCVGATLCIYNPDLDPTRRHAHEIVDYAARALGGLPGAPGARR